MTVNTIVSESLSTIPTSSVHQTDVVVADERVRLTSFTCNHQTRQ